MERDRCQHCTYEEDLFTSTAPSEDIWQKFELVPTPPLSPCPWATPEEHGACESHPEQMFGANLSAMVLQDCMWSGFPPGRVQDPSAGAVGTPAGCGALVDCVDPAAVLAFPPASSKKLQVSSGTESRTDSSEDEEIDVVTVESKQKKARLMGGLKPVTITVRADPHDPCMKLFHISIHQQQHNYAAPSPDSDPDPCPQQAPPPSPERQRLPLSPPTVGSPQSSDCEDSDRRKTHNYLERKRRNDLRSRFLALRDEIPSLVDCPKTPKVVILTKAREYLRLLHASDRHHAQERRQLKTRQQQLLRKLADLKRT